MWKKSALKHIQGKISPSIWDLSEKQLFDFNKTAITLSSQALVLSFTAIQIGNFSLNKNLIGWTWSFFLLVIVIGIVLYFLKYFRTLSFEICMLGLKRKKYAIKGKEKGLPNALLFSKELSLVYNIQRLMYYLSFFQLIFFCFAFIFLMLTAYATL